MQTGIEGLFKETNEYNNFFTKKIFIRYFIVLILLNSK